MLNIIELEHRWLRYKIKSLIPLIVITISLFIIAIIIFSFSSSSNKDTLGHIDTPIITPSTQIKVELKKEPIIKVAQEKRDVIKEQITKVHPKQLHGNKEKSQKVKLSPSLDFMKKMQNAVHPYYQNNTADDSYETDTQQAIQMKSVPKVQTVKAKPVNISVKKIDNRIQIKRQNTQNDIYDIIKRFKKNNNPALSLFVAKKYYELGNYRQAYNYALMTNKINNEIESSWIIFSKSLVKLGKKEKATKTLKKYIAQSHSSSAQILLDEIQSGKFR